MRGKRKDGGVAEKVTALLVHSDAVRDGWWVGVKLVENEMSWRKLTGKKLGSWFWRRGGVYNEWSTSI